MALYCYMYMCFITKADMLLPDPRDPLVKQVPATTIMSRGPSCMEAPDQQAGRSAIKRGWYTNCTPQQKAEIGKQASEHGVAAPTRLLLVIVITLGAVCTEIESGNSVKIISATFLRLKNMALYGSRSSLGYL